jgi:hypothetical protein
MAMMWQLDGEERTMPPGNTRKLLAAVNSDAATVDLVLPGGPSAMKYHLPQNIPTDLNMCLKHIKGRYIDIHVRAKRIQNARVFLDGRSVVASTEGLTTIFSYETVADMTFGQLATNIKETLQLDHVAIEILEDFFPPRGSRVRSYLVPTEILLRRAEEKEKKKAEEKEKKKAEKEKKKAEKEKKKEVGHAKKVLKKKPAAREGAK